MHEHPKQSVLIIGARGYSGLELARILLKHPHVKLEACIATESNWSLSDYLPENTSKNISVIDQKNLEQLLNNKKIHTAFLATPTETSLELVPYLIRKGINVIDLSGAYRLEQEKFETTYKLKHSSSELLKTASYGLSPWAQHLIKSPALISNPGCYATSVLMALIPLLKSAAIDPDSIVIDAKSGTTGAGKKAQENLLFSEVDGECLPYKITGHQHLPEIQKYIYEFSAVQINPFFITNLIPTRRGIISSIFCKLNPRFSMSTDSENQKQIESIFTHVYKNYPLVKVTSLNSENERKSLLLKKVVGSARTHIAFKTNGDKLYAFSLLDNLLKGAASQAVENFNRLLDLPSHTVIETLEGAL